MRTRQNDQFDAFSGGIFPGSSWGFHLVTEQTTVLCRMPFRKGDGVLVVALLAEFLGGLFAIGLDDLMELTVIIVIRDPAGRFRGSLPEECQDHDGNPHQQKVAFFERKSHEDLDVCSDWFVSLAVAGQKREPEHLGKDNITCRTLQPAAVTNSVAADKEQVDGEKDDKRASANQHHERICRHTAFQGRPLREGVA